MTELTVALETSTQVASIELRELGVDDTRMTPLTIILNEVESWYDSEFRSGDLGTMVQMKSDDEFIIPMDYNEFSQIMTDQMKIKVIE